MAKAASPTEVVADSEEEQPKTTKKRNAKGPKETGNDQSSVAAGKEADGNDDEEEEEYEIEAIIDAKNGAFPGGRMGYLVKWKGYDESQNSWVNEEDAANAQELIDDFWARRSKEKKDKSKPGKGKPRKSGARDGSEDTTRSPTSSTNKRKKSAGGRKSKSIQPEEIHEIQDDDEELDKPRPKKAKTEVKQTKPPAVTTNADEMDVDEESNADYAAPSEALLKTKSWENQVQSIDTIERIQEELTVFFTLKNGKKVNAKSDVCAKHFPQKLIKFYESNLRWRDTTSPSS